MTSRSRSMRDKLFSPAMFVALLALVISISSGAYALTITGANIKNGTVTTYDIKNNSLKGLDFKDGSVQAKDLNPSARGARAVASFYYNSGSSQCAILPLASREATSCTKLGTGWFAVYFDSSVDLSHTRPICDQGGNGGYNSTYTYICEARILGNYVEVLITRVTETTTSSPIAPFDPTSSGNPFVVIVP